MKKMNMFNKIGVLSVAVIFGASVASAVVPAGGGAVSINTASLTGLIDTATIMTGIGAIAALIFGPKVARWGYRQVMGFLKG